MSAKAQRVNILLVNQSGRMSGAEASLIALLSAMDRSRFQPTVACPAGELADRLALLEVPVETIPEWRPIRRLRPLKAVRLSTGWLAGLKKITRVIKSREIDIVHANSAAAQMLAAPAALLRRRPTVWHVRDMVALGAVGRILSRYSSRVIAISDAVKNDLVAQKIDSDKIVLVYNGIDAENLRRESRRPADLPVNPGDIAITMAAQFAPWKRHEDLIRAFGRIAQRYTNARCLIAGDDIFGDNPDYRTRLENIAVTTGAADRIHFLGMRDDVPAIIARSAIVVLPSIREPFGRAALEAMTLGVPVVGTRSGGLPELIGENEAGILVEPGDVEALAAAISKLLDDPELARGMGEAGMRRAERLFSARESAARIEAVYEDILLSRNRNSERAHHGDDNRCA